MKTKTRSILMNLHKNEAGFEPLEVVALVAIGVMIIGGTYKLGKKVINWCSGETTTLTQDHIGKTEHGFGLVDGEATELHPTPTPTPTPTPAPEPHGSHGNNTVIVDPEGVQGVVQGGGSAM